MEQEGADKCELLAEELQTTGCMQSSPRQGSQLLLPFNVGQFSRYTSCTSV